MEISIRPMKAADKATVMGIMRSAAEFNSLDVAVAEEVCDAYLADTAGSDYYVYVAEVDSSVVGYICYGATPLTQSTWDIYWIAVTPDRQGRGIGKFMLSFTEERIRENKRARLILIETSGTPLYERTRSFYCSQGYSEVCRIPDFYAPGDDRVTFQKRLS